MVAALPFLLPPVIAHRGASANAPENTAAALRLARAHGARWVEFDVTLSRDGVPVLFHDDDLDRTSHGKGPVNGMDWAELQKLDAGSWFGPAYAGEPILSFAEALKLCLELGLHPNIEIKPAAGQDEETAEVAMAAAAALWPKDKVPPLVSSFSARSLEIARDRLPDWPRGYLIYERQEDWAATADRLQASTIHACNRFETAETIAAYRASGRPVLIYTVNNAALAHALWRAGVSSVFTDHAGRLIGSLG